MWNSIKSLYKDFSDRLDPNGILEVSFKEPEYPYFFEFIPKTTPAMKRIKFDGITDYGTGRMKIRSNKIGKPIIADIYIKRESNSEELNFDIIRNDLSFSLELIEGFSWMCIKRSRAEKYEISIYQSDNKMSPVFWKSYEFKRQEVKSIWNKFMEEASKQ